ncbi:probable gluconokinase [Folsomia candida]|uniref:Gluconokinase n=1 Tax=Folsomia candida TaxID=158441 RepID=A0A226EX76_FOLCA|nr:probable gluconokinase [Folsomia candida]OXA62149.1 Thermosensitive gluconokinase [Folsomia candida]
MSHTTYVLIVMGPCGCGKSEVGQKVANLYKSTFVDADAFHPKENVKKMGDGIPLTDEDRIPWLMKVRTEFLKFATNPSSSEKNKVAAVVGCSALKNKYRDILRGEIPHPAVSSSDDSTNNAATTGDVKLHFILLNCSRAILEQRLTQRSGHFMKSGMLESQLNTLEYPEGQELQSFSVVNGDLELVDVVEEIETKLKHII